MNLRKLLAASATPAMALALLFGAATAQAVTYQGTILSNGNQYSLVHEGANVDPTNGANDWLRFNPGQAFTFDVTGLLVTATGPQSFDLSSNNGATATFVIEALSLELDAITGIPSGTMTYSLDGVAGMFTFLEESYGSSVFNSSNVTGTTLSVFLWGGDVGNDLGIDIGFSGSPIPLPPALALFGSALGGLAMIRRRREAGA